MNQISLVIILLAALIIPLVMARFKLTLLPTAVIEIIVGVILGPSLFNLIHTSETLTLLKNVGVIVLLFLSGLEIDFSLFSRKRTDLSPLQQKQAVGAPRYSAVTLAFLSYASIVLMSILLGLIFQITGLFSDMWLAAIIFMTISLGIVIAALKEKELLSKPFGQTILLISALGEVVPMFGADLLRVDLQPPFKVAVAAAVDSAGRRPTVLAVQGVLQIFRQNQQIDHPT